MTDKKPIDKMIELSEDLGLYNEQIMINGVDVSGCKHFPSLIYKDYPEWAVCHVYGAKKCEERCDCYFKQLARKTQELEELKTANLHIDTNRQCKGSKLKRIEELISACEVGYTDEFIQEIYSIIQEPEPTINDYSIIDRYRKALEEIEAVCRADTYTFADGTQVRYDSLDDILDIINKAKGRLNEE